jgi:3-oxoacyl-[acyl-carrier-protein] synthase II
VSQFAVAAANMAISDARIEITQLDPNRTGLCYGTTTGKPDFQDDAARYVDRGVAGLDPSAWAEFSPHAPASHIASELGFSGPIATNSAGCCTGLAVMEWGAARIATGSLDVALVGSADSLLSPLTVAAFCAGKLLTHQREPQKAARPFDLHRDGLVPGEAAGALVLESLDSALRRGAQIHAEYLGYGCTVDANRNGDRDHNGDGLARAVTRALQDAALEPNQLDCINSHGLSHPIFDRIETQGLKSALGPAAYNLPVTSIKSMTGACFAGDGILQIVSSCLMLQSGLVPPILNLETPDPACDLDFVTKYPRRARINRVLTNTRALGGANSVLILGRLDG